MDKFEERAKRLREIYEEERDDVLACRIIKEGERLDAGCAECSGFPFCKKVFDEESEGGG